MYCTKCGKQIEDNAAYCSHCGTAVNTIVQPNVVTAKQKKRKKSVFTRWWFWIIVVAVLFVSCVGSVTPGPEQPQISEAEYKLTCTEISFEDLARNPDNYYGELFTFTGEVIQVLYAGSHIELRIDVTPVTFSDGEVAYYEDTIYAVYYPQEGEDNILEGDIVTIYGQCAGEESYTSVLGATITLPRINIMYYELTSV